jgi:acyl-CoA synthetase (AMP-forming)/AMP-acid ligase II
MRIDYPDDEDHLKSQQQQISQVGEHPQATGHARKRLQPAAAPKEIACSTDLPRTRSGKIMRRLLREIVTTKGVTGDVTTLEDMAVIARLASQKADDE